MGAGKTTVAKKLAARLGYHLLDMDYAIEQEQGIRVAKIFEDHGEPHFRALETDLLRRLTRQENLIISSGGGVLVTPENIDIIRKIGTSVYLSADIEVLFERATRTDKRPLLRTDDPLQTMKDLFNQREKLYQQADIIIETNEKSLRQVTSEILQNL